MKQTIDLQKILDNPVARVANVIALCVFSWVISRGGGPDVYAAALLSILFFLTSEFRLYKQTVAKPTYRKADIKIFEYIHLNALPSDGIIAYLRGYDFQGAFNINHLDDLYSFIGESRSDPNKKFIDPELEKARLVLLSECEKLTSMVSRYAGGKGTILRVPTELRDAVIEEGDTPENRSKGDMYRNRTSEMNNTATLICKAYDLLVESAKHNLMID